MDDNIDHQNDIELLIWMNGKTIEYSFKYKIENISHTTLTAIRLKYLLSKYIFDNQKLYNLLDLPKNAELIQHLYTKNEVELEDFDIPYLKNNDILFFSFDTFSVYKSSNNYNQYHFIKNINSGGFGKVYLAREITSNIEYAIKEISTQNYSNETLYNMSREYLILKEMSHKNIIKFHTFFTYDNKFYIVMDYARGGELSTLLEGNKKLSEEKAKYIFKQIYNAVCYIHGKNIIHRDLKPNNILFLDEEKTHIVIIDFGISGIANGNQREKIKAGTVKYLPPEMLSGKEFSSNTKLDMWALGVILYRMVEGCYPFEGKNCKDTINNIFKAKLQFNPKVKISTPLKQLIGGLLEKNYRFRIDNDNSLFDNWFNHIIVISNSIKKKVKKPESYEDNYTTNDYVSNKYNSIERYSKFNEDDSERRIIQFLSSKEANGYLSQTKSTLMKCKPKIFYIKNDYSYMKKNSLPYKIELSRSLHKKNVDDFSSIIETGNENEKNNSKKIFLPLINKNNNNSKNYNRFEHNSDKNLDNRIFIRNGKNKKSYIYQRKNYNLGHNIYHHNITNYVAKSNDSISFNNSDLNRDLHIFTPNFNQTKINHSIKSYDSNDFVNKNVSSLKIKKNYVINKENKNNIFSFNKK